MFVKHNLDGKIKIKVRTFQAKNLKCDTEGRALVFDVNDVTFANFYLHSGNNREMRQG